MMGLRGMPEGEVVFDNCAIPASSVVAEPGEGFRQLMQCYNLQRVGAATVALGIAQGAFDLALDYARQRNQFGKPIADFQGIQWMLADMHIKLEAARGLVYAAAASGQRGFPDKLQTASAKVFASKPPSRW
jgi:alkylation response protein AidB-like acyl-CoA dehydrogenase